MNGCQIIKDAVCDTCLINRFEIKFGLFAILTLKKFKENINNIVQLYLRLICVETFFMAFCARFFNT